MRPYFSLKQKVMDKNEMKEFVELGELLQYAMLAHEAVMLSGERGVFIAKDMAVFRLTIMQFIANYAAYEYRNMSADDSTEDDE